MITLYGTVLIGDERTEITAQGNTYEAAHAALVAQVPEGVQLLGISRWPS